MLRSLQGSWPVCRDCCPYCEVEAVCAFQGRIGKGDIPNMIQILRTNIHRSTTVQFTTVGATGLGMTYEFEFWAKSGELTLSGFFRATIFSNYQTPNKTIMSCKMQAWCTREQCLWHSGTVPNWVETLMLVHLNGNAPFSFQKKTKPRNRRENGHAHASKLCRNYEIIVVLEDFSS